MSVVSVSVLGSVLLYTDLVTDFDVIISIDPCEIDILHAQKTGRCHNFSVQSVNTCTSINKYF